MPKNSYYYVPIRERKYLEELLHELTTGEQPRRFGDPALDAVFCRLRNKTNAKYGGTPDWQGETKTRAAWTVAIMDRANQCEIEPPYCDICAERRADYQLTEIGACMECLDAAVSKED